MFKRKLCLTLILSLFLSACSTTKTLTEEDKNKIKTAKINAQLGIAYLEQKNIQRAKQKLMHAINQAPKIPETWYSMAYFFEATGNAKEAKKHYLKAIALAPTRGDSQNNYGTFLCRSGEYNASIQHFMIAVQDRDYLDPADAFENAGLCALKLPDQAKAESFFQQALVEDPSRPVSLVKLAEISYKKGDYAASKERLSQFLTISPPNEQSQRLSKLLLIKTHPSVDDSLPEVKLERAEKTLASKKTKPQTKKIISASNSKSKNTKKLVLSKSKKNVNKQLANSVSSIKKKSKKNIAVNRVKKQNKKLAYKIKHKKHSPSLAEAEKTQASKPVRTVVPKKFHQVERLLAQKKNMKPEIQLV